MLLRRGAKKLLSEVEKYKPDAVLLGGDIFDDVLSDENAKTFVSAVSKEYKTYYVSGNHEWWSGRMEEMFEYLDSVGVNILSGEIDELEVGGEIISICGIDDPSSDEDDWEEQLKEMEKNISDEKFSVLLAHRPENVYEYFKYNFDLALCGHAHGGQWRLPLLINGFLAPNQGFFPKYAGGEYDFEDKKLIVSRGLARESTRVPRIFNRPELVFVTLK